MSGEKGQPIVGTASCGRDYNRDGTRTAIRSMHPPPLEVRIKKYPCIYIHEGGWPIGKLPFSEETLESDENQRVAKFTKIAGRWNHCTERKGNRMGGGKNGRGVFSPPYKRTRTRTYILYKDVYIFFK